ncbi:Eukaryotic translation initiation factor 3 subunit H [Yarrowia sp. C11]|nr:Eukaryotic translation initiation factor 3 subunit H [Yarrowia sp. C11]KAG5364312.1 Eukaryotic translation initiation factor 3 subunit H [Yarrowia sp. E02]
MTTTRVCIDSSVALKIVRHCQESAPSIVAGQLLGLDVDGELRISHSFAFPQNAAGGNPNSDDGLSLRLKAVAKYQPEMIDHLKEVNVDSNSVGWYQSTVLGRIYNASVIENLAVFQEKNPDSVVLVYDVAGSEVVSDADPASNGGPQGHTTTTPSGFNLRAFRLSEEYLSVRKSGKFDTATLTENNLTYHDVLVELPVEIKNSNLATLLLYQLGQQYPNSPFAESSFSNLNVSVDPFLEKNIEAIFDSVDDFHYDQGNYNYYQRQMTREQAKISQWQQKRKAENAAREKDGRPALPTDEWKRLFKLPTEPSRQDNLLISAQLNEHCSVIEEFGAAVNSKLFATQGGLL